MGCCQTYHCESCGLRATVSGGRDRGFYTETETRYCLQCEKLVDVGIRLWCKELLPGLLPASRVRGLLTAEKEFGLCPSCKSSDGRAWVAGHACPKCGGVVKVVASDAVQWI
jgi:hypothetical protein